MNGKKFEQLIKISCEEQGVDITRLRDAGYRGEKTERRFTVKNICDFILFNNGKIAFVEAKLRKTSLSFDDITQKKALLKKYESSNQGGILDCGVMVYFSNVDECWWVHVGVLDELQAMTGKKSFNAKDCQKAFLEHPSLIMKVEQYIPDRKRSHCLDMETFMSDC